MSAIPNKRRAVNFGSPILSPVLDGLIPVCFSCMTGEDGNLFGFRQVAPFPNDCGRQRLAAFDINRRPLIASGMGCCCDSARPTRVACVNRRCLSSEMCRHTSKPTREAPAVWRRRRLTPPPQSYDTHACPPFGSANSRGSLPRRRWSHSRCSHRDRRQ